jgi:hypothetical protein
MNLVRTCSIALTLASLPALSPSQEESLRVDGAHPRIFLVPRRLKLLRRERERQSLRWNQFQLLMAGKAPMPEPGFAEALYYQASGNAEAGHEAIHWALGPGADLRQLSLVFDWCQDILTEAESKALAAKLARAIQQTRRDSSVGAIRSRLLAAVALAGHLPDVANRELEQVVRKWWEVQTAPALNAGHEALALDESYALLEILHVVRDNCDIDLRDAAQRYFKDLPMIHLLSHYPASFPAGENEYRIPATLHPTSEPDLRRAALSRAAELSMVAFDSNAAGSQILQGWLLNDNFLLRGTFGAPYEFLWANPYQPGLSYYHAPLFFHDELFGRLFVRSSWEESATWLGYFDGELQVFEEGQAALVDPHLDAAPLPLSSAVILFGAHTQRFKVAVAESEPVFVVGLKPRQSYLIEVDNEEMSEERSDPGGILSLDMPHQAETGVRWREIVNQAPMNADQRR